jgi:general stress protein 26
MAKQGDDAAQDRPQDPTRRLRKLVKGTRVVMLTTVAPDGRFRSRPMIAGGLEDGALLFLTRVPSAKAADIADQQRVHLAFAEPDKKRYVSISGLASIQRDADRVRELWEKKHKGWFPEGKKDPDLAVLRVQIDQADVWDRKANGMVPLLQPTPATSSHGGSRRTDKEKAEKEKAEQPVGPGALG